MAQRTNPGTTISCSDNPKQNMVIIPKNIPENSQLINPQVINSSKSLVKIRNDENLGKSSTNSNKLTREQQLLLSELPTFQTNIASKTGENSQNDPAEGQKQRKLNISKIHISQSLDYFESQNFTESEFKQIEYFILERLDKIKTNKFGP